MNSKKVDLISLRFGRDLGRSPPVGALSLAACAERIGWEWELRDCQLKDNLNPFDIDGFIDILRRCEAPVLGLSIFNDAIPLLIGAFDRLGDEFASRRIFLGGPGVVGVPRQLLDRIWQIEAVVVGEGETALRSLLEGSNEKPMSGVFRRDSNNKVLGEGRTPREVLDNLPILPWRWCSDRDYSRVPLSTMRGCPFDCSFCEIIAFMGRKVTTRSLKLVCDDLREALQAIGTNNVDILDDTFTLNKKRVLAFCQLMRTEFDAIKFSAYSRVDTVDLEMMAALKDAGCERLFFGIDAGDNDMLKRISKRISIEQAECVVSEAAGFFDVTASFIWGYPFESWSSFQMTADLAKRFLDRKSPHRIQPQLHLLSPSAGTPLFEEYGDEIEFDEGIESLTCGTFAGYALSSNYREVEAIVRSNPILGAPFYRYRTPEFDQKFEVVKQLNKQLDHESGEAIEKLLNSNCLEHSQC